jgi:tyrosinase
MNQPMRLRPSTNSEAGRNALQVYAEGVQRMKDRSQVDTMDPIGWYYQSRIHGNPEASERRADEPVDWSYCKHGEWWFLPWHRMYLLQFERIIGFLTQTSDWSLPYWLYPDLGNLVIPSAFLDHNSSLFDAERDLASPALIAEGNWRRASSFPAFGGAPSAVATHRGQFPGALELNPHNAVHGLVGGDMAGFQSPLDPLFWIHHCNIDRLWETWLALGRSDPPDAPWLNMTFEFPDPIEEGGRRTIAVRDVVPASAAGYGYEQLDIPVAPGGHFNIIGGDMTSPGRSDDKLRVVAASREQGSVETSTEISLESAGGGRGIAPPSVDASVNEGTLLLRLENVGMDAGDASSMWNVYVRGNEEEEEEEDRHLVGTIAPFGLAGLTASDGRQTLTFDLSRLVENLRGSTAIEVICEPVREEPEGKPYWDRAALYTTDPDA